MIYQIVTCFLVTNKRRNRYHRISSKPNFENNHNYCLIYMNMWAYTILLDICKEYVYMKFDKDLYFIFCLEFPEPAQPGHPDPFPQPDPDHRTPGRFLVWIQIQYPKNSFLQATWNTDSVSRKLITQPNWDSDSLSLKLWIQIIKGCR